MTEAASIAAVFLKADDAEVVRLAWHKPDQVRTMAASVLAQEPDKPAKPVKAKAVEVRPES